MSETTARSPSLLGNKLTMIGTGLSLLLILLLILLAAFAPWIAPLDPPDQSSSIWA